jgi:branched-subunit amino acid transport protein
MTVYIYIIIMAAVTYLVRMLPLVLVRRKIKSRFIRSFLYYVPYTVLTAMTIPAIFFSTGSVITAAVGTLTAVTLAYMRKSLVTVAACAAGAVLLTEVLTMLIL